jgi:hypothetical protein
MSWADVDPLEYAIHALKSNMPDIEILPELEEIQNTLTHDGATAAVAAKATRILRRVTKQKQDQRLN